MVLAERKKKNFLSSVLTMDILMVLCMRTERTSLYQMLIFYVKFVSFSVSDPFIIKNNKKNLDSYCFVTSL
jgi:hypothetical protein